MFFNFRKSRTDKYFNGNDIICFYDVFKNFNGRPILKGVNFNVKKGDVVGIIGSSGAGKTTTARIINGLEEYNGGKVYIDGEILNKKNINKIRKITSFVFQNFNLFPNMSVINNITYTPINVYKQKREYVVENALFLLKKFNLLNKKDCFPHELSGGQKQRVAIIRSLILKPSILIMDEPTASLDPELTHSVIDMIKEINKSGLTILIITHDIIVAKKATNRIIMLANGKCVDNMDTQDFFDKTKSKSEFAVKFLKNCE